MERAAVQSGDHRFEIVCRRGFLDQHTLAAIGSAGAQRTFFDVLQERYQTTDAAYPGDMFKQRLIEKDDRQPIKPGIFDFFICSGGGKESEAPMINPSDFPVCEMRESP